MRAAHANAETTKVPVVAVPEKTRSRIPVGLILAAGVVAVGAAALTLGVATSRTSSSVVQPDQASNQLAVSAPANSGPQTRASQPDRSSSSIAASTAIAGEDLLSARIHDAVATSLPRIQAATATGTFEGSGLFVTDDGHIATSAGLIANADSILVWTEDGQRWKAHLVAADPISDIAILQIDSGDWPAVPLGTGSDLRQGQFALALDHDSRAIVFGEITGITGNNVIVEHPAAVPGTAILDDTGDVIAMVISDGTNTRATPAWMLEQVTVDLITFGSTTHTWLGVLVESDPDNDDMVVVGDVVVDSPAHEAGLQPGDLIDSVNGFSTPDAVTLQRQVKALEPGDEAVLTVTRNGSRRIIIAMLSEQPY